MNIKVPFEITEQQTIHLNVSNPKLIIVYKVLTHISSKKHYKYTHEVT